ncbi:hypothetical protein EC957_002534 [Mortierella hygrophila]|uniref:R3H-associated N-terminal domain-containing protein n=1 Tax=Mortierella hygrophila TaxID=979708 RepID=A0A9P6K1M3_9FUNG|nr:hypothetical protein EC957_002534 [Mortierella hygrophila]
MQLHQQSLERTLQSTITLVDADNNPITANQQLQRSHTKKKKKFYPWLQRDSQNQREKIGGEGSRRRQRHDNDKFVHHPFAVLYQADLAFPGYGQDAPSFHWKYDSVIESLIRNNPPSSRRSKAANASEEMSDATPSASAPQIGHRLLTRAQRKDIKKVHVPQGIVMQYEGELVNFLDQLTLSGDESEGSDDESDLADALTPVAATSAASAETAEELSTWVVVEKSAAVETQPAKEVLVEKKNETAVAAVAAAEEQEAEDEEDEERPQVYLRWDIQDQFLRFVAHALVAFYGLVSFSKTAKDGKRWVYICHPNHLDSIYQLASTPSTPATTPGSTAERPQGPRRQKTLEHVQEMAMHELEILWNRIEPTKLLSSHCPRPDMTFFEYLYPATQSVF